MKIVGYIVMLRRNNMQTLEYAKVWLRSGSADQYKSRKMCIWANNRNNFLQDAIQFINFVVPDAGAPKYI